MHKRTKAGVLFILAALLSPSVALALPPTTYACGGSFWNGCDVTYGGLGDGSGGYWMYSNCGGNVVYLQGPTYGDLPRTGCPAL